MILAFPQALNNTGDEVNSWTDDGDSFQRRACCYFSKAGASGLVLPWCHYIPFSPLSPLLDVTVLAHSLFASRPTLFLQHGDLDWTESISSMAPMNHQQCLYGIATGKRKECLQHLPNLFHLSGGVGVASFFMNTMEGREMKAVMFVTLRVKASAIMASRKDSSQRRGSPCSPNVMNFSKIALCSWMTRSWKGGQMC